MMKQNYHDIIDRFGEPIWWDEAACPRSTPFTPTLANGFHAREVALRITSQHCRHEFAVCVPSGPRDSRPLSKREFPLVYGDPHRDCCQIEASATSDALAIMGLWSQDNGQWIVMTRKSFWKSSLDLSIRPNVNPPAYIYAQTQKTNKKLNSTQTPARKAVG